MAYIDRMAGHEYIDKTREYLDYLEDHLDNVARAFQEVSEACNGMIWVSDDYSWHTIRQEVILHDLSKFTKYEFVQYRDKFFPTTHHIDDVADFDKAWDNHKKNNTHHWETAQNYNDIIHMIIDWTAMGFKFGDTAQDYYENNKNRITIKEEYIPLMYEIFERIKKYNGEK